MARLTIAISIALSTFASAQSNLRATHADGQTFLTWTDDQAFTGAEHWAVYRSDQPIVDLSLATRVGRLYPQDALGARLSNAQPGATWTIPTATPNVTETLAADEALFVYTPRTALSEYFAVVKAGETALGPDNTVGPVAQTTATVRPHAQLSGVDAGHPYTLYAVWTDGDDDPDAGRPDFPVFGPASYRGMARLFCVFEPTAGLPPAPMPAVVFLHGGGGNYWNFRPSKSADHAMDLHFEDGLYVTFDNRTYGRGPSTAVDGVYDFTSRWFGTCSSYDRFEPSDRVPLNTETVVDWTPRFFDWVFDLLIADFGVDEARFALMGNSMGGRGVQLYSRLRPQRISAATAFVMPVVPGFRPAQSAIQGTTAQNLPTSVPGAPGIIDLVDPAHRVSSIDLPFMRLVHGTEDDTVLWDTVPALYDAINADRWGTHMDWDERTHTNGSGGWETARFALSPRHSVSAMPRHRNDRSFPAFHDVDHGVLAVGVQPDPGDAVLPANGDPWGSWGGWFDWDETSLIDRPRRWAVELGLVQSSPFAADVAPTQLATASVTLRRTQEFQPGPGTEVFWGLRRVSTGALLDSGRVTVDAEGLVTIPSLLFGPELLRLDVLAPSATPKIRRASPPQ